MEAVEPAPQLMNIACPGCGDPLKMLAIQETGPVAHVWQSRTRMVSWKGHNCPELGPMPDPVDTEAVLKWVAGTFRGLSAMKKNPKSALTAVTDNSRVEQSQLGQKPERKPRKLVHIPYDTIECPALPDCHVSGRVPGVRRHVGFMHPDLVESTQFPPNRTLDGLIINFENDEQAAERLIDELGIRKDLPENASWEDVAERVLQLVGDR